MYLLIDMGTLIYFPWPVNANMGFMKKMVSLYLMYF